MEHRGTPVSRDALYEEVWRDPMTIVAPRYGMSDVGLMKICKKLRIPVPGRGYWAKVKAGRPTRTLPLPPLAVGARTPPGPIPLSEQEAALRARVQDVLLQTRQSQPAISVPSELVDPHPLVRAAAARLRQRDGWDHPAGVRSAPKEVLDIQVTKSCLDRALRLMDTLFKAIEPSGFTAHVDSEKGVTVLVGNSTTLSISLAEQISRTAHTPTRKEVRARDRYYASFRVSVHAEYPDIPRFDWHATGRLTLTVGGWPSRRWNDTERGLIDSRLRGVIAGIVNLAEEKRIKEAEEERRRNTYEAAAAEYKVQVQARNEECRKLSAMFRDATRLHRANRLREFIAAVEERASRAGELTPEKQAWIAWANAKADWIDPLVKRDDPIMDAPEPREPSLWDF